MRTTNVMKSYKFYYSTLQLGLFNILIKLRCECVSSCQLYVFILEAMFRDAILLTYSLETCFRVRFFVMSQLFIFKLMLGATCRMQSCCDAGCFLAKVTDLRARTVAKSTSPPCGAATQNQLYIESTRSEAGF